MIFLAFVSVLLVACGGGNSNSSSGFAPKNAEAFETKFVNQIMTLSSGTVAVVLLGKRFRIIRDNATEIFSYTYTNTGANTATSSTIENSSDCTQYWTWTSALAGNASEGCADGSGGNYTFVFSGSN